MRKRKFCGKFVYGFLVGRKKSTESIALVGWDGGRSKSIFYEDKQRRDYVGYGMEREMD